MLFPARRLCQSVLAPAEANPALVHAEGRSELSLPKRKTLQSVMLLLNQRVWGLFSETPQPVAVQHQLP